MSGNPSRHSPPPDPGRFTSASDIVRSILDDRPPTSNVSPSGELYRAIERFHRNLARSRRDSPPAAQPADSSMSAGSEGDLRRRFNRDPQPQNPPPRGLTLPSISAVTDGIAALPGINPPLPPLRSLGSRRGSGMSGSTSGASAGAGSAGRSGRYRPTDRHPDRPTHSNFDDGSMNSSFEVLARNLEDATSQLRAQLDFDSPALMSPSASAPDHPDDGGRRIKRRKLDSDRNPPSYKGFRYGKYGQVEPGPLTMEIVSCDGGLYFNESSYSAENILKKDDSVYCTKGNRCNIVLRHQDSTVFSLQELVVKAPGINFSSPVREGMVFVAMESDDLLSRTAQYQIQYVPSRGSRRRRQRGSRMPPIYSVRHDEDGNPTTRLQSRYRSQYALEMDDDDDDDDDNGGPDDTGNGEDEDEDEDAENIGGRVAHIPAEFAASPPPFNITTECSEDDQDDFEPVLGDLEYGRPRRRPAPDRIGSLPFEGDSSEDDDDEDEETAWGPPGTAWPTFEDLARGYSLSRILDGSASIGGRSLAEARDTAQVATQEAVRAVGGELMTPLAHFFIDKDKNKCTIRFDPPVSGRFILLKMWNPHHDPTMNIDIQGVIAKGFAGPRYFPAVELR